MLRLAELTGPPGIPRTRFFCFFFFFCFFWFFFFFFFFFFWSAHAPVRHLHTCCNNSRRRRCGFRWSAVCFAKIQGAPECHRLSQVDALCREEISSNCRGSFQTAPRHTASASRDVCGHERMGIKRTHLRQPGHMGTTSWSTPMHSSDGAPRKGRGKMVDGLKFKESSS